MIFLFPNHDALTLALTSGTVPVEVSAARARGCAGEDGTVSVEPAGAVPRTLSKALSKLGVRAVDAHACEPVELLCWPQALPLEREAVATVPEGTTAVLFELPDAARLPELVGEMLRLGNDRQGFRDVVDAAGRSGTLLKVISPPYYSLLRAIDRDGDAAAPRAYTERAPGVWVEVGYRHPLLEMIRPPAGQLLLLGPPHDWRRVDEGPFRDIYEVLEFPVPHGRVTWAERPAGERLRVPLRLAPGGATEPAELWVLREEAAAQAEELVRSAGDALLARLAFAVGHVGGEEIVVLRVRPSRQPPPVLVVRGQAYRPYLKLPNLFLPCGLSLHPPLRRDAVRKRLADDPEQVTWLHAHPDHSFTPESIPERAFRPLSDWVEYVLTRERTALEAWAGASVFDFERFVGPDDEPSRESTKREREPRRESVTRAQPADAPAGLTTPAETPRPASAPELPPLETVAVQRPDELQRRQRELEDRFLAVDGPPDAAERQALWPELARVYAAQGSQQDAAVCWANALWRDDADPAAWARAWHRSTSQGAADVLASLPEEENADPAAVRRVVAALIDAAARGQPDPALANRLGAVQAFLRRHEGNVPVRAAWLAALAVWRLTGDVLGLAHARDRLLERLYQHGLSAEHDLPSFLRFRGSSSDRFRAFRHWLRALPERVRAWLERVHSKAITPLQTTQAYADLMLAFGFARLGENDQARGLHDRARAVLGDRDDVHTVLLAGFGHRIAQALAGTPTAGSLPAEQLEYLDSLEANDKLVVDRLRQYSQILEPHERIDAYRGWYGKHTTDVERDLAPLADVPRPDELERRLRQLFAKYAGKTEQAAHDRARVLTEAVALSPRVGEAFALPLLAEVLPACDHLRKELEQARLLERAMAVAAHFNQTELVQALAGRFERLAAGGPDLETLQQLGALAGQTFRGLRKLGLRDVIYRLLEALTAALTEGKPLSQWRNSSDWWARLLSLLHVAGGQFYFGRDEQARPVLDEARHLLYRGDLNPFRKALVAGTYVRTLGQAPVEVAQAGVDDLLHNLAPLADAFVTNTHYSFTQLQVIEAVVLAVATEEFAMGSQARRWLDDDEYLVRQRVHRDLREAVRQQG